MSGASTPAGGAPAASPATPAGRPVRRAPADLPFDFATADLVATLVATRGEPDWLRADREAALAAFAGKPVEPSQLYTTYVDFRKADLFGAEPYVTTAAAAATADPVALPEGADGIIEIIEDGVGTIGLSPAASAAGVILETFGAALARDPDGLRADLTDAPTLPADDPLAQAARATWSQGVRLVVPDGVVVERPILIRWQSSRPGRALVGRTIVRLGAGASAAIVEELLPSGGRVECAAGEPVPQGFLHGTLEVTLGRDANLAVSSIQDLGPGQVAFQHRDARIGEGAELRWALAQLGGRLVRSRVDNRLEGDRSSVEQVEIILGTDDQLFDLTSYTRHIGRDTTGNLLSKGVLLDEARSYMKGLISIEKSAVGTDSYLGEFGMNLSKSTRAVAIPSLEIDQPDCRRAAHASSVGPIDEGQLFYLQSRGIERDVARKFIVLGFLEPVVSRVPLAGEQERLRELLDAKWTASVGAAASGGAASAA